MNIARLNSPSLVAATHCLSKYDSPGPRYTSYPTANLFRQDIGQQQYLDLASNEHLSIAPLSLYVHIPFCKNICYYCGCNKVVTKQSDAGRKYLDMLAIELKAKKIINILFILDSFMLYRHHLVLIGVSMILGLS